MKRLHSSQRLSTTLIAALFLLVSLSPTLFGASGKITGRVIDRETREPLPSANVMITHMILSDGTEVPLDRPVGAGTDASGYYFILNVPPGTYILKVSMVGYGPIVQKFIRVDLDRTDHCQFRAGIFRR